MPEATPVGQPIALLGTGLLGAAIATRLLQQGETLGVWNRTPGRCAPLLELGARGASEAAAAVAPAQWVITVLSDGPSTEAVLQGLGPALAGKGVIQIGTIGPDESQALAAAVQGWGGRYLEAPVLGSRPEALAGQLQLMAGGSSELVAEAMPLLRHLATAPVHVGPVGSAMATKLALNQLIASLTHSFSLSLHLVQRSGVPVETFMALLRGSGPPPALSGFYPYTADNAPSQAAALAPEKVGSYSQLMAASQPLVAAEILDAYWFDGHRRLLDVGGGEGRFLCSVAERAPHLQLTLFDLPAVAERATQRFAAAGIAGRAVWQGRHPQVRGIFVSWQQAFHTM